LYYGLHYYAVGLVGFTVSVILKKVVRRARPKHNAKYHRVKSIRGKEIDTSFPSGDVTMAACFTSYLYFFMPEIVQLIPGKELALVFIVLNVAFGRVFF
jgi:membrane-associated phospholipid phosphatase